MPQKPQTVLELLEKQTRTVRGTGFSEISSVSGTGIVLVDSAEFANASKSVRRDSLVSTPPTEHRGISES
jgi:hypothetical protein